MTAARSGGSPVRRQRNNDVDRENDFVNIPSKRDVFQALSLDGEGKSYENYMMVLEAGISSNMEEANRRQIEAEKAQAITNRLKRVTKLLGKLDKRAAEEILRKAARSETNLQEGGVKAAEKTIALLERAIEKIT